MSLLRRCQRQRDIEAALAFAQSGPRVLSFGPTSAKPGAIVNKTIIFKFGRTDNALGTAKRRERISEEQRCVKRTSGTRGLTGDRRMKPGDNRTKASHYAL